MAYTDNFDAALVSLVTSMVAADRMNMSEMLYEASFAEGNLADQHTIITGVRNGHTVPILNDTPNVDSFPFVDESVCAVNECNVATEFSAMTWSLGLLECRVPICLRSFSEDFLLFFNQWRQTQEGEPDLDSAILAFIGRQFTRNHAIAEWRAAYFADASSLNPLYNGFDGIFAQAEANPELVIDITENAAIDYAGQTAITGEAVYNYLIAMYDEAALHPWFDPATFEFRLTKSLALKLVTWLNKLGLKAPMNCACIDPATAVARPTYALSGLQINGIPVLVHSEWDLIINNSTELNGGGGANPRVNPHRAILAARRNVLIGTSETAALRSFDIWYSKDQKKVFLEGSSYLGAALPLNEYILGI